MPSFTVNLPGGGQTRVNAKDEQSAIGNAGGGTIATAGAPAPTTVPAPARPAAGATSGSNASVPAPAAMPAPAATTPGAPITVGGRTYDTNNQSDRADLRTQGYYIDNSGIYSPGAGARVGSTFSGANAAQNVAPSANQLPIINGVPVSPSNGYTGANTGAIMYRGDPQYQTLFGQGTTGFSAAPTPWAPGQQGSWNGADPNGYLSGKPVLGAPADAAGQQSLADWNTQQAAARPKVAPAPAPAVAAAVSPAVTDPIATAAAAAAEAGNPAAGGAIGGIGSSGPTAGGPTDQQVEQYAYDHQMTWDDARAQMTAGATVPTTPSATPAAAPAMAPAPAAAPIVPAGAATTPAAPAVATKPASDGNPNTVTPTGLSQHTFIGTDGKPQVVSLSDQDYQAALADQQAAQAAVRQAAQFAQGISSGQLDVQRATQVAQQAYNDALVKSNSVQNAQTALRDAMQNEISKQTEEINAAAQAATAQFQQGQLVQQASATAQTNAIEMQKLDAQRQAQAMTNSTEQDKLSLARQQGRGRRLPQVRYA